MYIRIINKTSKEISSKVNIWDALENNAEFNFPCGGLLTVNDLLAYKEAYDIIPVGDRA